MNNKRIIAIIDASSASVTIKKVSAIFAQLDGQELEDALREHYQISSDSDFIFGDLSILIDL